MDDLLAAAQSGAAAASDGGHMITLLTVMDAAERLAVSPASVRRLIRAGQLPAVKLGRLTRIDPSDLDALVHNCKARPAHQEKPWHSTNAALSGGFASPCQTVASYGKLLKLPTADRRRNTTTNAKRRAGASQNSENGPAIPGNKPL